MRSVLIETFKIVNRKYDINPELERLQSRRTDPLLLIYSFQFRSAFLYEACADHAQHAQPATPTSVTDTFLNSSVVLIVVYSIDFRAA